MSIWLLTDASMDAHASAGHPERPDRREAVAAGVRDGAAADAEAHPLVGPLIEPQVEPLDDAALVAVHDPAYLAWLTMLETQGGGWLDPDTFLVPGSLHAGRVSAGATVQAALAVALGAAEIAFAVGRPPGHHASAGRGGGFCLFNNVALAVAGLRSRGLARRIGIIDWDVHHGDGTQAIFDADSDLCYASTHQSLLYPGTGDRSERGVGIATGTKHNRPLAPGSGDDEFIAEWQDDLLPAIESFGPDALLVSAGYDAHLADPLANLAVTEDGFASIARLVGALSVRLGLAGIALTLEGGYDLEALRGCAAATVRGILDGRQDARGDGRRDPAGHD